MDIKLMLIIVLMIVAVLLFSFIGLSFISEAKRYEEKKKRLNQLNFKDNRDVSIEEAIDKITKIVDMYIFKIKTSPKDKALNINLKMIGWDKYFGPKEWKSFVIFMSFIGVVAGLLFGVLSPIYGLFIAMMFTVLPTVFLSTEIKDKKMKLMDKFPDIIIITEGYLSAGFTLSKAMEETIPFAGKSWQPILKKLVADIELMGVESALNNLKEATTIPEVREFASLVKIAYAQGDVGESFSSQADRMLTIQEDMMMAKIAGRRSLASVANAPTILAVFLLIGAPAVTKIMEMSAMS